MQLPCHTRWHTLTLTLTVTFGRYQLYQSDPSGNYGGWKATAIGANQQAAQNILKQEYKDDISLADAVKLVVQVGPGF